MHFCNLIAFRDGQSYPALDVEWDTLIERYPADNPLDPQHADRVIQAALGQISPSWATPTANRGRVTESTPRFGSLQTRADTTCSSARSATPWTSIRASVSTWRARPRRFHLVEPVRKPPHLGRQGRHPLSGF